MCPTTLSVAEDVSNFAGVRVKWYGHFWKQLTIFLEIYTNLIVMVNILWQFGWDQECPDS